MYVSFIIAEIIHILCLCSEVCLVSMYMNVQNTICWVCSFPQTVQSLWNTETIRGLCIFAANQRWQPCMTAVAARPPQPPSPSIWPVAATGGALLCFWKRKGMHAGILKKTYCVRQSMHTDTDRTRQALCLCCRSLPWPVAAFSLLPLPCGCGTGRLDGSNSELPRVAWMHAVPSLPSRWAERIQCMLTDEGPAEAASSCSEKEQLNKSHGAPSAVAIPGGRRQELTRQMGELKAIHVRVKQNPCHAGCRACLFFFPAPFFSRPISIVHLTLWGSFGAENEWNNVLGLTRLTQSPSTATNMHGHGHGHVHVWNGRGHLQTDWDISGVR